MFLHSSFPLPPSSPSLSKFTNQPVLPPSFGVDWIVLNTGDGDLDILVSNMGTANELLLGDGSGGFTLDNNFPGVS